MTSIERAIAIRAEARSHNRMSRWHKAEARRQMEKLRAFCEAHGIEMEIVIARSAETENQRDSA